MFFVSAIFRDNNDVAAWKDGLKLGLNVGFGDGADELDDGHVLPLSESCDVDASLGDRVTKVCKCFLFNTCLAVLVVLHVRTQCCL